ncbi:MAG: erythromycin biosynthesis sensory transduction protein EryC1 [Bacteroidia bacterium]|nr:MAG: erythromycin biosynthesis sensory transduction protein EryC1 [Bacteroidia bacterium]
MIEYENLHASNKVFLTDYVKSFEETLNRGWFILGKSVERFEEEFADYVGTRHCIGVASGLDALILSIKALHIPEGSEILIPANTYVATILAALHCRCVPVLVEPDRDTCNIDPTRLEDLVSPHTRAVIVVHLYGKPCDMDPIMAVVNKNNLFLIEDCAQSHGARYKGTMTGMFGHASAFSFYPTKNLGALGDAGAIVTNDPLVAEEVRKLRNYGSSKKYLNDVVGYNSRLDEVQAGFLSVKLKRLEEINSHKRALANVYHKALNARFRKPVVHPDFRDVYHIFNVRHPRRDALREYLLRHDIKTEIHYPVPPHRQKALEQYFRGKEFPVSDEIHSTTLSLPISFAHSTEDITRVAEVMNSFPE